MSDPDAYRHQYVVALTRAISASCDEEDSTGGGAFDYRGRNLRFAVERALYFEFLDEPAVYATFAQTVAGSSSAAGEEFLARRLRARIAAPGKFPVSAVNVGRGLMDVLRRVRIRFGGKDGFRRNSSTKNGSGAEFIFFFHHPKYYRYLETVLTRFGSDAGICNFAGDGATIVPLSVRTIPLAGPSILAGRVGKGVARFPYLLRSFDMVTATLRRSKARCVVLLEGNAPNDEVANQAAKGLGLATVCVQQGWSPVVHSGFRNMSFNRMLTWGNGFSDLLSPYNPRQRFEAVGNPAISAPSGDRPIERRTVTFFLQVPGAFVGWPAWTTFLDLAAWTAETFPDVKVLIREHPAHQLSPLERRRLAGLRNVAFAPSETHSISQVLGVAGISVTMFSSTVMESIAVGVVPVIANFTSIPGYWPDVAAEGAAIEVREFPIAQAAVSKILSDPDYYESFAPRMTACASRYFAAFADDAARNIEASIRAACV